MSCCVMAGLNERFDGLDAGGAANRDRAFAAHFHAVPFARIVRGGDHDAAIRAQRAVGEVAHRCAAQADVDYRRALLGDAARQRVKHRRGVGTHIAPDNHRARPQKIDERPANIGGDRLGERAAEEAADVICLENAGHGCRFLNYGSALIIRNAAYGAARAAQLVQGNLRGVCDGLRRPRLEARR